MTSEQTDNPEPKMKKQKRNKKMKSKTVAIVIVCLLQASVSRAAEDIVRHTRVEPVEVEILVPKESRPVKGILVHVFNYELKTHDRNATFCRQHHWAHINTIISRKANNRPEKIRAAINTALRQWAEELEMPELVHVPRAGVGFSAGGMCIQVLETDPDRMLTNAVSCSWVRDPEKMGPAAEVPHLFIIGAEPDAFKMLPAVENYFEPAVKRQRPWALGLQHGCKHDWANSGTLAMAWLESMIKLRYPADADPSKPIPLRQIDFETGWRGDRTTINGIYATVAPASEYQGSREKMTWLPDRATAYVWRAWQTKKSPVDMTATTASGDELLGEFQPRKGFGAKVAPGTDLVLGVRNKLSVSIESVKYYHGDELIGEATGDPWTVSWSGRPVGCYAIWAEYVADGKTAATNPAMMCFEPQEVE